ncbi:DNA polymerase III subunit gamma/tau [Candidatus Saccharibacteria bacterium]|nr:DNA polymerase III subunit gamma/tau [Candidatus Saccharibacteria bacterium]
MKALYRKYRPTSLSEVVGQSQVTKTLESSLEKGKISHSYLFTGPRGCGKTSVARIFAHEINGFKYELEDFYPDILEIDAASNTGVDNIRELRERAAIAPTEGKYKVYIIDEVHMLSKSAFNALLKTLEEPPAHVVFIMATTDVYKVPITIKSRSQIYEFQLAEPSVMHEHLKTIAKAEGIKINDEALEIIVRRGGGSFRDSISLLDQISTIADGEITASLISSSLGLPEQTKIMNLLEAYRTSNLSEISASLKTLLNSGVRAEIITEELINYIVDNPAQDLLPLLKPLSNITTPFPEAKLLLAFTESISEAVRMGGSTSNKEISPRETTTSAGLNTRKSALKARPDVVVSNGREISRSENPPSPASQDLKTAQRTPSGEVSSSVSQDEISRSENPPSPASQDLKTEQRTPPEEIPSPASQNSALGSENPPSPASQVSASGSETSPSPNTFTWESYFLSVQSASPSLADILLKTSHELSANKLIIVPEKNVYKNILNSKNNSALLQKFLPNGYALEIKDQNDAVISTNDAQISKLSAIMGGKIMEVKDDHGGNPF